MNSQKLMALSIVHRLLSHCTVLDGLLETKGVEAVLNHCQSVSCFSISVRWLAVIPVSSEGQIA